MMLFGCLLKIGVSLFSLMLFFEDGVSFGIYNVFRNLPPLGWAIIILLPLVIIGGTICFAAKVFKKPKLK